MKSFFILCIFLKRFGIKWIRLEGIEIGVGEFLQQPCRYSAVTCTSIDNAFNIPAFQYICDNLIGFFE